MNHQRATRDAHDLVAPDYRRLVGGPADVAAWERAALARFVGHHRGGLLLDVGCGTGRLLPHLAAAGPVVGVDLSPGMLAVARREAGAPLVVGALDALPVAPGAVAGAVAWYSTMYLDDDELSAALAELARVVRPGGPLLLGFHVGAEVRHLSQAYGHQVDLTTRRRPPDAVVAAAAAGWVEVERRVRPPQGDEVDPQAAITLRCG